MLINLKRGGALTLAAVAAAGVIAGCGSSKSNEISAGKENAKATEEVEKVEASESKSTTSSAIQMPTSGPLAQEPKVKPLSGPAPSKLETKELIKGTGAEAKAGASITVDYVGVLYKTGKVFNSSWESKQPFTFVLGEGKVIKGWDNGVVGMRVGGRRELIIPAAEAYGSRASAAIPANSPLVFVVDLLAA